MRPLFPSIVSSARDAATGAGDPLSDGAKRPDTVPDLGVEAKRNPRAGAWRLASHRYEPDR